MRWTRNEVRAGMTVTSTKGERLGNVVRVGSDTFVVEKGVFFPKDYELRYDHIISLDGEQLGYSLSDTDSRFGNAAEAPRAVATAPAAAPAAATPASMPPTRKTAPPSVGTSRKGDVRIPLMEEEIGIEKIAREAGHVEDPQDRQDRREALQGSRHPRGRRHRTRECLRGRRRTLARAGVQGTDAGPAAARGGPAGHQAGARAGADRDPPVIQAAEKEAFASLRHEEAEIEDTRGRAVRSNSDGGATRPGTARRAATAADESRTAAGRPPWQSPARHRPSLRHGAGGREHDMDVAFF